MKIMKRFALPLLAGMLALPAAQAETYTIDTKGTHAFIQFRIQHLGFSWLYGRFEDFSGSFEFDEAAPENASVTVDIDPASIDSNHAERDKHLRGDDFLAVDDYPEARFVSTSYQPTGDGTGTLTGDLTLRGVTREVAIDIAQVGAGKDPWGGYRRGFEGTTSLPLKEFGIDYDLGPAATHVEIILSIEGIRQ